MKMLVLTQEKAQKSTAKGEMEENMFPFRDSLILNGLKLIINQIVELTQTPGKSDWTSFSTIIY